MNAITPPSGYKIAQAMSAWMSARARLLNDGDLEHDEAALADLLGPEEGDVRDILSRLLTATQNAAAMAEAAGTMIENLAARRDRYKRRCEDMRGTAFAIMDALGERKVELPHVTATIRAGLARVIITDTDALPDEFVRVVTTRTPDKAAILAALKQGEVIEGAEISNGLPSIQLRSK